MTDQTERLFCVGTHRYSFRVGEPAEVTGVAMLTPEGKEARPVFVVQFLDGVEDQVAIFTEDGRVNPNYELVGAESYELAAPKVSDCGRLPEVATGSGLEVALARAHEVLADSTPSGPELIEALHHLTAQVDAGRKMLGAVKGQIAGERVDEVFFGGVGKVTPDSGISDLLHRPEPGDKPGGGVG